MSIDTVKSINQYFDGINQGNVGINGSEKNGNAFEQTLKKFVSENQGNDLLSNVVSSPDHTNGTGAHSDLEDIFTKAAETYDVPVELLKAVAKAESGFNPNAVSKCGAMGIMQLMPATAKALGVVNAYDPEQNIMGGAHYISQKLKAYNGDITLALAAYNAGSGNVAKYGGVPPFAETQNYIKKIYGYMGEDIKLPELQTQTANSVSSGIAELLGGTQPFTDQETEKAYLAERLQILCHQLDMQGIFASDDEEENNSYDLGVSQLINSLKNL